MTTLRMYPILLFVALHAHVVHGQTTFRTLASTLISLIQAVIPVVMALAFVFFLWQGAKLVLYSSNDKGENKTALFWSLVVLFVMVTLWGIIQIIKDTFLP